MTIPKAMREEITELQNVTSAFSTSLTHIHAPQLSMIEGAIVRSLCGYVANAFGGPLRSRTHCAICLRIAASLPNAPLPGFR